MTAQPTIQVQPPAYTIVEHEAAGYIHMTVEGFFDLHTLSRHFAANAECVKRWRSLCRAIRVLITAVDLQPHTPEGQAFVQESVRSIYVPGDKVAITVLSNLVKMQMRRALAHGDIINFFVSDNAARTWLLTGAARRQDERY